MRSFQKQGVAIKNTIQKNLLKQERRFRINITMIKETLNYFPDKA